MTIESYFDFLAENDIRIKGTRIGIETILGHYLAGVNPELIAEWYPELSLEQIFATLTYYFANREKVDDYLQESEDWFDEQWRQQHIDPSPVVKRLRRIKREQELEKAALAHE
ncbi:DUF433 domain-containing protein [Chloroflexi bacterium TSY]|nr:DUF433 domain-containing protein [Chloroflexi bacterium TSY]